MPTPQEQQKILEGLVNSGVSEDDLRTELPKLTTKELQHEFYTNAAKALGMDYGTPAPEQKRTFTPDANVPSALETWFRTARDTALSGYGEQAVELGSRLMESATKPPSELFRGEKTPSLTEAAQPEIQRTIAGQAEHPGAELAGTFTGMAAQQAAAEPLAGPVTAKIAKTGAKALSWVGKQLSESSNAIASSLVKLGKKAAGKLNEAGIAHLGQLLRDEGVVNTPRTLARVGDELSAVKAHAGSKLGTSYELLDNVAPTMNENDLVLWAKSAVQQAAEKSGRVPSKSTLDAIESEVLDYTKSLSTKARENLKPSDIWKLAKSMEKESGKWLKSNEAKASLLDQLSNAFRDINQEIAKGLDPKLASELAQDSHTYGLLKVANKGIHDQLLNVARGAKNIATRSAIGATIGGTAGATVGGYKGAIYGAAAGGIVGATGSTVPVKTARIVLNSGMQRAADFGAKLLSNSAELGKYYPILVKALRSGGLSAVSVRHAHLMMDDPEYAKTVEQLNLAPPEGE